MIEYYITRLEADPSLFKIAKFDGNEQPENVYFLKMVRKNDKGWTKATDPEFHCDCPNRRRGKHINDKHGVMAAKWLLAGQPEGYFDEKGNFHGTEQRFDQNEHEHTDLDGNAED